MSISMVVQPPAKVKKNIRLWPYPTAVYQKVVAENDAFEKNYFARAVSMFDEQGNEFDELSGTKNVNGKLMAAPDSAGTYTWVFPFTKLAITKRGTFSIRIDIYDQLSNETVFVGSIYTSYVTVSSQNQPVYQPSRLKRTFWESNEFLTIMVL